MTVTRSWSREEEVEIGKKLETKLEADELSYRSSGQGGNLAYVEGWRIIQIANETFGFNGWSSEILENTVDFCDDTQGRVNVGITCRVRVTLRDGSFHDDIGYGTAENQRGKGAAFEKAKKEAVTDAIKRALRQFGDRLGNCAYDKVFLRDVKEEQNQRDALAAAACKKPLPVSGTNQGRSQIRPPTAGLPCQPVQQLQQPPQQPHLHHATVQHPSNGLNRGGTQSANFSDADLCNLMMVQ